MQPNLGLPYMKHNMTPMEVRQYGFHGVEVHFHGSRVYFHVEVANMYVRYTMTMYGITCSRAGVNEGVVSTTGNPAPTSADVNSFATGCRDHKLYR